MDFQFKESQKKAIKTNDESVLSWRKAIVFGGIIVGLTSIYYVHRQFRKNTHESVAANYDAHQHDYRNNGTQQQNTSFLTNSEFKAQYTFTSKHKKFIDFKSMIADGILTVESLFRRNRDIREYNRQRGYVMIGSSDDMIEECEYYNICIDASDTSDDFS